MAVPDLTLKQMLQLSFREAQILSEGEEPTAEMIIDGKVIFAQLIASWSFEGLLVPYIASDVLVGDTTKASYTWGPGGDIPTTAPVNVAAVSFVIENAQIPLARGDNSLFMGIPWLGTIGQPNYFYFELGTPNPSLRFDVAPYGGAFRISSWKSLDNMQELTDTLVFPDAYARMIRTNLAIELCASWQQTPGEALVANAIASKKIVKRYKFAQINSMRTDLPGTNYPSNALPLRSV